MGIQCGIVGLPNVGKSTLFNALTRAGIDAENFPFCTIEPNTGVVPIPDPRQGKIADLVSPERNGIEFGPSEPLVPRQMHRLKIAGASPSDGNNQD